MHLQKRTDVLCRIRNMMIMQKLLKTQMNKSGEPERNPRFLCGIRWRECLLEEYGAGYSSESCGAQVYRQPDRNADGGRNQTGGI